MVLQSGLLLPSILSNGKRSLEDFVAENMEQNDGIIRGQGIFSLREFRQAEQFMHMHSNQLRIAKPLRHF